MLTGLGQSDLTTWDTIQHLTKKDEGSFKIENNALTKHKFTPNFLNTTSLGETVTVVERTVSNVAKDAEESLKFAKNRSGQELNNLTLDQAKNPSGARESAILEEINMINDLINNLENGLRGIRVFIDISKFDQGTQIMKKKIEDTVEHPETGLKRVLTLCNDRIQLLKNISNKLKQIERFYSSDKPSKNIKEICDNLLNTEETLNPNFTRRTDQQKVKLTEYMLQVATATKVRRTQDLMTALRTNGTDADWKLAIKMYRDMKDTVAQGQLEREHAAIVSAFNQFVADPYRPPQPADGKTP